MTNLKLLKLEPLAGNAESHSALTADGLEGYGIIQARNQCQ